MDVCRRVQPLYLVSIFFLLSSALLYIQREKEGEKERVVVGCGVLIRLLHSSSRGKLLIWRMAVWCSCLSVPHQKTFLEL